MNEIAIIGIGCRYPGGVKNLDDLWELIANGIDATTDVPKDRWDIGSFYHPDKSIPGKTYNFHGGFLDNIDTFDAGFFNISPREAAYLDPQQRILLETSWDAMEDAGLNPLELAGKDVGVYIGAFTLDYQVLQFSSGNLSLIDVHTGTGSMMTMVSNRLSYIYDFRGPSLSVDTACSSSLVATHLACQALNNRECSIALAGGVNIIITPEYTIAESKGGFLSPDGRSKAFDANANGYARGEGAGVIVLKPLEKALEDNDLIYGVILGTAVNQDGHTNGITVPRGEAQEQIMKEAYRKAGISPSQISYVEAHGTGTPTGDPIEANSIANVLSIDRPKNEKCFVGSIKTNIGHLEAASGLAGLIKSCLILKKRQIPPHINFQNPNPFIPFEKLCIKVPTKLEPLPKNGSRTYIGINSFGFGGTNAHIVLADPPEKCKVQKKESSVLQDLPYILPLSARSETALNQMAQRYLDYISSNISSINIEDLGYSASQKRSLLDYRLAIAFRTKEELCQKIDNFLAEENRPGIVKGRALTPTKDKLVFVYTGMGPIWWAMGRQLLQTNQIFKNVIEQCDQLCLKYAGWSLLNELTAVEKNSKLDQPAYAQPANFAVQAGLTKVWESLGIVPEVVVGHSIGEIGAAYAAGVLSLEDAVRVSIERSRWQQKTMGNGTMLAVSLSEQEAETLLKEFPEGISIAAVNSPKSVTLSGDAETLEKLRLSLESQDIFARFLRVNVAYHSYQMDAIKDDLLESLQFIRPRKATIPIYSTVTGQRMEGTEYSADYWWSNVRQEVRFQAAMTEIINQGFRLFLEIGPHPVLNTAIEECLSALNNRGKILSSIRRKEDEPMAISSTLGALFTMGYPLNWKKLYPAGNYLKLPQYAWQQEEYWVESQESKNRRLGINIHPILGRRLMTSHPAWEVEMDVYRYPFLKDHKIQGGILFPGSGYVELALACARELYGNTECVIENIHFNKAIFLKEEEFPIVQTTFEPSASIIEFFSRPLTGEKTWTSHSSLVLSRRKSGNEPAFVSIKEIQERCPTVMNGNECYKIFYSLGLHYGPCFQGIKQLWKGNGEILTRIEAPAELGNYDSAYTLHPALLDACFQGIAAMVSEKTDDSDVFLPVDIEKITVYKKSEPVMWCYVKIKEKTKNSMVADLQIFDQNGRLIADIKSMKVQSLASERTADYETIREWLYSLDWVKAEKKIPEVEQSEPDLQETWLVLGDKTGLVNKISDLAQARGVKCIPVQYNEQNLFSGSSWFVNPDSEDNFINLLKNVDLGVKFAKVIYLWPLDSQLESGVNPQTLQAHAQIGCLGLLNLLKALNSLNLSPKIWITTRGGQTIAGIGSEQGLLQSSIWGIARVFGHHEMTELWGGIVDLDPAFDSTEAEKLFEEIVSPDGEDQIGFRGNERFILRLNNLDSPNACAPIRFDKNGGYLITGAFGALGMLISKWMVKNGASHLILMGRTAFPERSKWHTVESNSKLGQRIKFIHELESLGANIHVANVDVTDKDQLDAYLRTYEIEGWPKIRGVIHTAGIVKDKTIQQMDMDTFKIVYAPKVLGGWNLHQAFINESLDFFILFSSTSSLIIISMGQSNYASGNAFLDSLANYRMSLGLPALSINWGPWSEVGMAEEFNLIEYFKERGVNPIPPREGMIILSTLLGHKASEAVIGDSDWTLISKSYPTDPPPMIVTIGEAEAAKKAALQLETAASTEIDLLAILRSAQPEQRQSIMEQHLKELIARVLRFDQAKLDIHQPLNVLGLDSMMGTEIKHKIRLLIDVNVPLVDLLEGYTISQLSARILQNMEFA